MSELKDLQKRIGILEDIEAIRRLKAKKWRCFDKKLEDEFLDLFTEDIVIVVMDINSEVQLNIQGKKALAQFHKEEVVNKSNRVSVHQGHNPEIEITSDTTARAVWALNDKIIDLESNTEFEGWGNYHDEYVKENGKWRIKSIKVTRLITIEK